MKHLFLISFLLTVGLTLAACGTDGQPALDSTDPPKAEDAAQQTKDAVLQPATGRFPNNDDTLEPQATVMETLIDEQGAVTVAVSPLNVGRNEPTLDFEVVLNTHSVDLSMDLVRLAWLTFDTGVEIAPIAWEAPRGGHHVTGVLSFPAEQNGQRLLDEAAVIQLILKNVDAPTRTFTWSLQREDQLN
ncbi:MAG: hypothetical protein R3300_15195 [Candidatus Promineifilaceae bacterium]|nr:hypothetical protein [Candidatus Promineifilaceae bacterium]